MARKNNVSSPRFDLAVSVKSSLPWTGRDRSSPVVDRIWLDGRFIHLPEYAQKKVNRQQRERWIRLSDKGRTIVRYFFKTKPLPSWNGRTHNMERWAESSKLDPMGLGPKTTRKTWESWLVSSYPERFPEIVVSQGHTTFVAVNHYLGLPFDRRDKEEMSEWVSGREKYGGK